MGNEIIFRITFFILLGAMLVVRIYFNLRIRQQGERVMPDREAIRHEGVVMFATRVVLFFVLIAILVLYAIHQPWMQALDFTLPAGLRWFGFVIGLVSIAFLVWTQVELGRQFSPQLQIRQEHQLITAGPYTHIRHPLYTAVIGFGLALALVSAHWIFLAFFILSLAGLWFRVPKEERMLIDQFGEEYKAYMQRTGKFLPKV